MTKYLNNAETSVHHSCLIFYKEDVFG